MTPFDSLLASVVQSYAQALEEKLAALRDLPYGFRVTRPELSQVPGEGDTFVYRYESVIIPDPEVPAGTVVYE